MENNFYKNNDNIEKYIKMAEGHDGKLHIEKLYQYLPFESSILEIGTGPGTDWTLLNKNYNVTGSDFSEAFLSRLREKNPNNTFINLDAETLLNVEYFDSIYSNKVLHHLSDEALKNSINRQIQVLNKKGIICHSFWKGAGTENYDGMFVNNHTVAELNNLFTEDFDIILLEEYEEFEPNDSIILIARKR